MVICWIAYAICYLWALKNLWSKLKGSNEFPGTEAGLVGCFMFFFFIGGGILGMSVCSFFTFSGLSLLMALIGGIFFVLGTAYVMLYLGDKHYERVFERKRVEKLARQAEFEKASE